MKKIILSIILFCSISNSVGQNIDTKSGLQNAMSAYGYLMGQDYMLNQIKKEYSQYYSNAIEAELMFKISFGNAKANLENLFKSKFGDEDFIKFKDNIISEYSKLYINSVIEESKVLDFLEEVKNRSKGKIESPTKEIILFYNFYNDPAEEFFKGFTYTFRTKGHEKSKNTDWQFKIPISWVAKEADRPNIIQKFVSEGGFGNESIMIMVKTFPEGEKISKEEVQNFFTENESKGMIPKDAEFISFKKMTFDNIDGGMLEFYQTGKRLDIEIKLKVIQFYFIYNSKLYNLTCNISSEINDNDLSQRSEKFSKLFKLVANTIVINKQYNKK